MSLSEPLDGIYYDVVNSSGEVLNEQGLVVVQEIDPISLKPTTTWFKCFDLELAPGANTVTLRATDRAGNLSTYTNSYTLDLASDATAPVLTLHWPQDGEEICGSTFTLRGQLDDPTAKVTAQITDASGNIQIVQGLVERNGLLWVEDLHLADGNSTLELTMTDAAGNVDTLNLSVAKSAMQLIIDEVPQKQLWNETVTVTGTINLSDHTVWVNGVRATLNGDGTWSASDVPPGSGGTAVFQAVAIPNSDNGGNGSGGGAGGGASQGNPTSAAGKAAEKDPEKDPLPYVQRHTRDYKMWRDWEEHIGADHVEGHLEWWDNYTWTHELSLPSQATSSGKRDYGHRYRVYDNFGNESVACGIDDVTLMKDKYPPTKQCFVTFRNCTSPTGTGWQSPPGFVLKVWEEHPPYQVGMWAFGPYVDTWDVSEYTTIKLRTGGKARSQRQNIFRIEATATEFTKLRPSGGWDTKDVLKTSIRVLGKQLDAIGVTYKALPDNEEVIITPSAPPERYTFTVIPYKHKLVKTYACQVGNSNDRDVGVGEIVGYAFNPSLPANAPAAWGVDGGALSGSTWNSTTYTATDVQTPAAQVSATVRGETIYDVFDVLAPTGYDRAEIVQKLYYGSGVSGAGMRLNVWLKPTNVSFHRVQIMEVGGPASGADGYFLDHAPLPHGTEQRANQWYSVGCDNLIAGGYFDKAEYYGANVLPYPWSSGSFEWQIPVTYKVGNGSTHALGSWVQEFSLQPNGTFTVSKFGKSVTRTTNDVYP